MVCRDSWFGSNAPTSAILARSLGPTGCRWVSTIARYCVRPFCAVMVTPSVGGCCPTSLVERGVLDRNAGLVLGHHTLVDAGVVLVLVNHGPTTPASSVAGL